MTTEARRFLRYDVDVQAEITVGGRRIATRTQDLGAGGCRLVLDAPLARGERVTIRLHSPRATARVEGDAVIAWAGREPPFRVGVAFSDAIAEQAIVLLQQLMGQVLIHVERP